MPILGELFDKQHFNRWMRGSRGTGGIVDPKDPNFSQHAYVPENALRTHNVYYPESRLLNMGNSGKPFDTYIDMFDHYEDEYEGYSEWNAPDTVNR